MKLPSSALCCSVSVSPATSATTTGTKGYTMTVARQLNFFNVLEQPAGNSTFLL